MDWHAFWSAVIGSSVPASITSLLVIYLTHRNNRAMERHKVALQQEVIKFTKWHEKRMEALEEIYKAFCDYLDYLRRSLYFDTEAGRCMDPMHEFRHTITRKSVYLDETMAEKIQAYDNDLLVFWNESMVEICNKGEVARGDIRKRLDYEIPAYLPRLRKDINEFLDPNYKANGKATEAVTLP